MTAGGPSPPWTGRRPAAGAYPLKSGTSRDDANLILDIVLFIHTADATAALDLAIRMKEQIFMLMRASLAISRRDVDARGLIFTTGGRSANQPLWGRADDMALRQLRTDPDVQLADVLHTPAVLDSGMLCSAKYCRRCVFAREEVNGESRTA